MVTEIDEISTVGSLQHETTTPRRIFLKYVREPRYKAIKMARGRAPRRHIFVHSVINTHPIEKVRFAAETG